MMEKASLINKEIVLAGRLKVISSLTFLIFVTIFSFFVLRYHLANRHYQKAIEVIGERYTSPDNKFPQLRIVHELKKAIFWNVSDSNYHFELANTLSDLAVNPKLANYALYFASTYDEKIDSKERLNKFIENEYKKAIELDPVKSQYHIRLGWFYDALTSLGTGDFERASLMEFDKTLKADPTNSYHRMYLGIFFLMRGYEFLAFQMFGRAIALVKFPQTHHHYDEAIRAIDNYRDGHPNKDIRISYNRRNREIVYRIDDFSNDINYTMRAPFGVRVFVNDKPELKVDVIIFWEYVSDAKEVRFSMGQIGKTIDGLKIYQIDDLYQIALYYGKVKAFDTSNIKLKRIAVYKEYAQKRGCINRVELVVKLKT